MTERHLQGFLLLFAEIIDKEKSGKLSNSEAYNKIKQYVELVVPDIKKGLNNERQ